MSIEFYRELKEAESAELAAQDAVCRARKKVESLEMAFMEAMPVGKNSPCCVAILPTGDVVVHVWVEPSSCPNQLHVVSPIYCNEDASPSVFREVL